jgi:hypothetical protein
MASGLLVGGAGAATAVADTGSVAGNEATSDPRADKTPRSPRASEDSERADQKPSGRHDVREPSRDDDSERREVKVRSGRAAGGDAGEAEEPRPPCCESGSGDCGPGTPLPDSPSGPPTYDGEYGENRPETLPPGRPMPPMGGAGSSDVLDVVPGVGPNEATHAPINVPIVVARPIGVAPGAGAAGSAGPATGGAGAGSSAAPRPGAASSTSRRPLPAAAGGSAALPASAHRIGYAEHLRGAGIQQLAALALPGLAGILILTGAGGLVGYRQAKAGQYLRPTGIARFMN